MLARAKELFQQGTDVVVGIVETHGRIETLKFWKGCLRLLERNAISGAYFRRNGLGCYFT